MADQVWNTYDNANSLADSNEFGVWIGGVLYNVLWSTIKSEFLAEVNSDSITQGSTKLFMTSAERTKLTGIETGATADQTGAEMVTAINSQLGGTTWQGGGGAGVTDGDKGDITVSGSGATWTVDADAITYAKIQNVSQTNVILGRDSAGAGNIEEITPAAARTLLDVPQTSHTHTESDITDLGAYLTDAPSNGSQYVRKDGAWAVLAGGGGGISNIVEDTTPQLGGNLDMNGNKISGAGTQTFESTNGATQQVAVTEAQMWVSGIKRAHADTNGFNVTGNIAVTGTVDGRDVATDGAKLDAIEAGADVTDTTNVTAAGALMDSELAGITHVKALNQSVISGASPTFGTANMTDATNKRFMTDAQETKLDSVESGATADQSNAEIETAYNAQVSIVSQAEAEAGTATTARRWTAQRVAQAIAAQAAGGGGSSFTNEGAWATATAYQVDDYVRNNGVGYLCIVAHTSGTTTEPGVGASWTTNWEILFEPPVLSKTITVENPNNDIIIMFRTDVAITVREINAVIDGSSTPSINMQVVHDPNRSALGNDVISATYPVTSTTTGHTITSFFDPTIPANSWVWVELAPPSGTVNAITIDVRYTED